MPQVNIVPYTPEWYAYRRSRLGASDISALFDLNKYKSKFTLWHEKAGTVEPEEVDNPNTRVGRAIERQIGIEVSLSKGWDVVPFGGLAQHPEIDGFFATPDFEVTYNPERGGKGLLEVKNVGRQKYYDDFTAGEPSHGYILQLQAQLACAKDKGFTWGAIGAWCMGEFLFVKEYDRRPEAIEIVEREVKAFWQSIKEGVPPAPSSHDDDFRVLKELFPVQAKTELDLSDSEEFYQFCIRFEDAAKMRKEYDEIYSECRNNIKAAAQNNSCITCKEYLITIDKANRFKIINRT